MKTILLTKGAGSLVDDSDYEFLNQWNWHITSNGYAARSVQFISGKKICILMHRQILGIPDWVLTDHADGNKLNNQKSNLRLADKSQNEFNRAKRRHNSTGYKGVFFDRRGTKNFYARCIAYGNSYYSKYFETPEEAALAYDELSSKHHGKFARLNCCTK